MQVVLSTRYTLTKEIIRSMDQHMLMHACLHNLNITFNYKGHQSTATLFSFLLTINERTRVAQTGANEVLNNSTSPPFQSR